MFILSAMTGSLKNFYKSECLKEAMLIFTLEIFLKDTVTIQFGA